MCLVLHLSSFVSEGFVRCFEYMGIFFLLQRFMQVYYMNMCPKELIQPAVEKYRNGLAPEADSYWLAFQHTTTVIVTEGPRKWCVFRHILWTLIMRIIDDTFVQVALCLNKTLSYLIKGTDYTFEGRIAL